MHKHAARRLHYDLRLEAGGVLVSWAVPKGPSYDPRTKRLAVRVEDHPLEYGGFEGRIPRGGYGAGAVIVWDEGTYRSLTGDRGRPVPLAEAVERGHLSFWLEGRKLRGGWSLTRTGPPGERESWLLLKRSDELADPGRDVSAEEPLSVVSGRSVEEVAIDREAPEWEPGRATWLPPMLAQPLRLPREARLLRSGGWVYQRKLDGLRCIAVRNGGDVRLWSRNHQPFTERFAQVAASLASLPAESFTLDGELVAFEGDRTSFALLQRPRPGTAPVYCAFDVLHLLGRDTTGLPFNDRARLLAQALAGSGPGVRAVEVLEGDGEALLERACRSGWEGLVAKRAGSPYLPGRRSADWRKLKCSACQELVVGGWTDPSGTRKGLGAILVGYYDDGGRLRYAGKVGTGFDERELEDLRRRLGGLATASSPFEDQVPVKGVHWARPELVAAVELSEWTPEGRLRHPRYVGLRPDRAAAAVRREGRS